MVLQGWHRYVSRVALATLLGALFPQAGHAAVAIGDPGAFLRQTESLRTTDHPEFKRRLALIHRDAPPLTPQERWHLRYLDAYETMFEGDNLGARPIFEDVIEHSGDPVLVAKSRSLLLSNYAFTRQYQKAFTLANQLVAELPNIQDVNARLAVLTNLSQTMNGAGQIELALKYAQMMADATPPGMSLCYPLSDRVFALSNGGQIDSDSKEYTRAIDTCVAAGQAVLTNTLWLDRSFHMLKEGKPAAALAVLDRIDASIQRSQFGPAMVSEQVQRARAYEKLGEDSRAARAAMAAIAMRDSDTASEWIRDAYRVLYQLAKKQGNASAALQNYEKYVAQNQGYLNDVTARTIAFQTVQQQSLTRKLEAEELSRQNSILKLQQQLDAKAVETGRLYIVLLLIGLTAIVLWLLRLKHSQMRFRHMATRDGLTGILNHQHFIHESERQLRQLERKAAHASMLWMDLDHFKQINDTHGHAAGDAMLRHVVRVCQDHLRPGDLFGRLGGEEFGILLLECESDHAVAIADRIRLAIESAPMDHEGLLLKVSASVGVASSCSAGHALQRLCRRADAALYRAKRGGRNRVVVDTGEEMSAFA